MGSEKVYLFMDFWITIMVFEKLFCRIQWGLFVGKDCNLGVDLIIIRRVLKECCIDWFSNTRKMSNKNPLVYFDVSIDGDPFERMVFELFSDTVPKTAENFRALCTVIEVCKPALMLGISQKIGRPLHYKGSFFHRIIKGSLAQGGDFFKRDGSHGESIYGGKFPGVSILGEALVSPVRPPKRSLSRSSGRAPSRRSLSRSPVRSPVRSRHRSYSRSPVGARRGRSPSRSVSPDGSPKRIRRGRGFSNRYSYARRYHSPDRSPVRSYRYGRSDHDRYSSYRRRSPMRDRSPLRYRARISRTRSPSASRSPVCYRRRYSHSRSPVDASRYRPSPPVGRRRAPRSRTPPSRSRSPRSSPSPHPRRSSRSKSKSKSISRSSGSPPAKKGLVSYGDGSPDSGQK
ncbi:hypothetical protein L1987_86975 [Smallanthus sonchifolius]|uniref:Uncharacterized protein n=1 Tax=Smallanthus sonchifolius TaxID=185202 RepID=A0ACB8Y029_9ASTR|nr:hypothetical protein L1987_86975 [Smallanthus sonchifolius]